MVIIAIFIMITNNYYLMFIAYYLIAILMILPIKPTSN